MILGLPQSAGFPENIPWFDKAHQIHFVSCGAI